MAQAQFATVGPLASASTTNIRTASAISAAGSVTLNGTLVSGGVATLDKPRRILFTFASSEVGHNYVLTGTNWGGNVIGETIVGTAPGAVASVLSYATLTSVVADAASTGNVSIGTNALATSPWVQFDRYAKGGVAIQLVVTGTVNYTLQQTLDDPNSTVNPVLPQNMTWFSSADTAVVAVTASAQTNYMFPPVWARILLSSGTGSVAGTFVQGG